MAANEKQHKEIIKRLDTIQTLLQNLIILHGAQAELNKADVRKIARVNNNRLTEIWANAKGTKGK